MNLIQLGESLFEERVAVLLLIACVGAWGFTAFTTLTYYL
jgi:hypothetical protein